MPTQGMRKLLFALFAIVLFLPLVSAQEIVDVGIYVLSIGKFDVSTGSYSIDFYLSMKCEQECDPTGFEFMNGRVASIDKIIDEPNEKFYRILANLNSPIDLKRFPFDWQKIQIILEDKSKTTQDLQYRVNMEETGIDESIAFAGWEIENWDANVIEHAYPIYDEEYSQYVYTINISRIELSSFLKTFLPVFFIVLVVLFSFILDPDKVTTRLGMAGSSLVASVMFHVSINNQIPPVGYLTIADRFMILTYFIILATFFINIMLVHYIEIKKTKMVDKIHKGTEFSALVIVPLLYILFFVFV